LRGFSLRGALLNIRGDAASVLILAGNHVISCAKRPLVCRYRPLERPRCAPDALTAQTGRDIMVTLGDIIRKHARRTLPAAMASALSLASACDDRNNGAPTLATFDVSVPANFTRHEARGGQLTVRAPPSWKETRTSGTVVLNLRTDQPGSSLNVQVIEAGVGEALDKTMASVPEDLRHEFADFREIKNDLILLNDTPAGRIVYEASRGGFHGRLLQVFIMKHKKHYILTYTATPERFDVEEPAVEQVVASFRIEK
jgi:hypothetical protein